MSLQTNRIYEFGEFRLDLAEKTLRNGDVLIPITPKVLETLLVFLETPGCLVSKDRLIERIWKERYVEESNLSFNIKMLRKALGDDASHPRFIETIPKQGFRFIAHVTLINPCETHRQDEGDRTNPDSITADTINTDPNGLHSGGLKVLRHRIVRYMGLGLAVILLTTFGFYIYSSRGTPSRQVNVRTFAVLPIRPIDSATRDQGYEIGIAESLINRINSINGLFARPLTSTKKYTYIDQDSAAVGRELNVDYILVSTYQLFGGKIRITSRVLNVNTGLAEETYTAEANTGNIFIMQDMIAEEISSRLVERFVTSFRAPTAKRGTENVEAYRLYLDGMYLYDRRAQDEARKALAKFDQALALDPAYALAWAGKAHVHRSLGNFGGRRSPHDEYNKSIEAVNNALALDKNLSDAYSALCENKFFYEYDYDGAETACKQAIELDPTSHLAREIYARCLWTLSRFDEAIVQIELAIDIEPTSLFSQRNYAITFFYAGRHEEAIRQFKRVSERDPNFSANYAWFVPALLVAGLTEEAFEEFIRWQKSMKLDESGIEKYKAAYRSGGWPAVGRERVKRFDEDNIRSYFLEACLTAHTGNTEKTLEYLEKSLERREWGIPFLRTDPSLEEIRTDPRFDQIANRVEARINYAGY